MIDNWFYCPIIQLSNRCCPRHRIGRPQGGFLFFVKVFGLLKRVSVYIDGFNLFHAIKDLEDDGLKWVNLWRLSEQLVRDNESVGVVKYFSAYAKWRETSYRRHQRYVHHLENVGVRFIEGNFKRKWQRCRQCNHQFFLHEEKETDVNIGAHLLADTCRDRFDRALIVSADSDLNEAVVLARNETSGKLIDIVAPPGRNNRNSRALFEITIGKLRSSLFTNIIANSIEQGRR